jgi:hypothetical protein
MAVMPVVDIADLLGYSRSAITKAIKDHEGKMSPCKTFLSLPTKGGYQQFLCLNRTGVDYLLIFIHPSKTRMSDDEWKVREISASKTFGVFFGTSRDDHHPGTRYASGPSLAFPSLVRYNHPKGIEKCPQKRRVLDTTGSVLQQHTYPISF